MIGRGYPIELGIVAELGEFIDDLIRCGKSASPNQSVVERRTRLVHGIRSVPFAPPSTASDVALVRCIGDLLPRGAHLFIDACVCAFSANRYMTIDPPTQVHNAFSMEPMGWAPAAVVGAALADPEAVCVSISGDGGFMMNGNEVSTAAQYNVGAIWVVHANNTLAAVEVSLEREFGWKGWMDYYKLGSPNLAMVARGLGADAFEADSIEAFRSAFADALTNARVKRKPQVVVASL